MEKRGMSGSTLKIIAIVTMLIDHIGAAVIARMMFASFLEEEVLYQIYRCTRTIGRVAFPIFCFLLVEGFFHTHDAKKYAIRLGIFAVLSEIPFDLAFHSTLLETNSQNVFFTLLIGFLTMMAYQKAEQKLAQNAGLFRAVVFVLIVMTGMGLADFLKTDYAGKGVFCIWILYLFRGNKKIQLLAGCMSFLWEPPALFGFLPIAYYNGKRGFSMKYFFYLFYPVHLLCLYAICCWMGIAGYAVM